MGRAGRDSGLVVQRFEQDTASNNITSSAYDELDSSLNTDSGAINVVNDTGAILALAIGPAGSEQQVLSVGPNTQKLVGLALNEGMRLSITSVDTATVSSGFVTVELLR